MGMAGSDPSIFDHPMDFLSPFHVALINTASRLCQIRFVGITLDSYAASKALVNPHLLALAVDLMGAFFTQVINESVKNSSQEGNDDAPSHISSEHYYSKDISSTLQICLCAEETTLFSAKNKSKTTTTTIKILFCLI